MIQASPWLLTGFNWKKTKSHWNYLCLRSICQLHPLPSIEPWTHLVCVWVWKAGSGMHMAEMWCSQHLSWAPCLACQTAELQVEAPRRPEHFLAMPGAGWCSSWVHVQWCFQSHVSGPRLSHCHMWLDKTHNCWLGLCSSTEAAWTFSSSHLGFVEILWLLQAETYSQLRVASNVIGW